MTEADRARRRSRCATRAGEEAHFRRHVLHEAFCVWHRRRRMAQRNAPSVISLVIQAQLALGMTQSAFGEMLGLSRATIGRWSSGRFPGLIPSNVAAIATALYPIDPALASQLAVSCGTTLESLGIVAPIPATVSAPTVSLGHLVDSVVCAAADAGGQLPSVVRPALAAAFARARDVGLSMEDVVKGLKGGGGGS